VFQSTLRTFDESVASTHTPCRHVPQCPSAAAPDHAAARVAASHPEQGWSVLCNGVVVFDDLGEILPDGTCLDAYRPGNQRPLLVA
jgi:Family of unknown function (DUF5999)